MVPTVPRHKNAKDGFQDQGGKQATRPVNQKICSTVFEILKLSNTVPKRFPQNKVLKHLYEII